jgi:hypothetical protein
MGYRASCVPAFLIKSAQINLRRPNSVAPDTDALQFGIRYFPNIRVIRVIRGSPLPLSATSATSAVKSLTTNRHEVEM